MNTEHKKITVVIADDHVLMAEAWATLIGLDPRYEICKLYDNTRDLLDEIKELRPNIVLLDINIKPISGIDATKDIKKLSPGTKIIGVSMHNQPSFAKKMIRMGASGYVTKNSPKAEMYAAIDSVLQGKIYLCSEIQNNLAQHLFEDEEDKLSTLTERELEIVKLIKKGLTSQEISDQLFLSIRTVDTHRSRILKKLGLTNTAGVINLVTNSYLDL